MMRVPSIHVADAIKLQDEEANIDGKWVLARPLPYENWKQRWKLAWMVFTGKADVVTWIGQEK